MRFRPRGEPRFGRRRDQWRVVMLVGTLIIILLSIFKSADPRHWAWVNPPVQKKRPRTPQEAQRIQQLQEALTQQASGRPGKVVVAGPAAQRLEPPTAQQQPVPPEVAGAQDLRIPKAVFSKINENALFIRHAEGEAYWTVFTKLRNVPEANLEQAALQNVTYAQLFSDPDFYRGQLLTLEGELLRLNRLPPQENPANIQVVYEGWLRNADSGKNPYVFHCLDKPAGLAEGNKLNEKVSVTGYFFKRYQYPAQSGLTYAAPMLLAKRIRWFPPVQRKAAPDARWIPVLLGGIAFLGISLGATICFFILREQRRSNAQLRRFAAPPIADFEPIEFPDESGS